MLRKIFQTGSVLYLFFIGFGSSLLAVSTQAADEQTVRARLEALANSEHRSESLRARNPYRHPVETLLFFELRPDQTVVEIWPGGQGGWYRSILEPFLQASGTYIPVPDDSAFPGPLEEVPDGIADRVLVFRAHGFLIYDKPLLSYYAALYRMLKPGGIFGIVDHREFETREQDPKSENGYVKESYVIALAESVGFEFVEKSEINANPLDTKDYPDGLYSLPPVLKGTFFNRSLREKVLAIGESDRMTLKFRKPL
ncbi:MAG: methyltransferase [Pseudomonadales bacterium]|nr:methyltransferase [Pseudomonadales bacterium]